MSHKNESTFQRAIALWMLDGGFERHLRRSSQLYKTRLDHTDKILQEIQQDKRNEKLKLEYQLPAGGLGLWLKVNVDCKKLASKAHSEGILIQDESFFSDKPLAYSSHIRLGFGRQNETSQQEGIEKLMVLAGDL